MTVTTEKAEYPKYFGYCPKGNRVHGGDEIEFTHESGYVRVKTKCGNSMLRFEEAPDDGLNGLPWVTRRDFCRICFRAIAWEIFQSVGMEHLKSRTREFEPKERPIA